MLQILSDAKLLFFFYNFINKVTKKLFRLVCGCKTGGHGGTIGDHCKVVFALLRILLHRRANVCVGGGGVWACCTPSAAVFPMG
jgi:hypothetical protein